MRSILIANSDQAEIERIQEKLSEGYEFAALTSADQLSKQLSLLQKHDLVFLDQNLTENKGIDVLMEILAEVYIPVLMVTSPGDPQCASEALSLGTQNYIGRTKTYIDLLDSSIKEAIRRHGKREEMKQTIITLQQRIVELEVLLSKAGAEIAAGSDQDQAQRVTSQAIMEEVVLRLKKGEVNLPAYPDINIGLRKLLAGKPTISDITNLLKKDMAISSRLLAVSNSPYYRGIVEHKSLEQAVSRLGISTTRNCVEIVSNRALYANSNRK